jgi:transcriptional regulator with PAS, ATPase and Fis domain
MKRSNPPKSTAARGQSRLDAKQAPESSPLLLALEQLGGGAVVVLDRGLHIVDATPTADALLGTPPRGVLAPKVLCGSSAQRPIAEALAAGRAAEATIPSPLGKGQVRVHAQPLHVAGKVAGFVLLFEAVASDDEAVNVGGMWTRDPAMKHMFHLLQKVAASDSTVLVRGESGTGKELVARAIHDFSTRASGPFHAVNCAAMPAALLESELFGHVRGAFTGAVRDNPGHFRLAHGGTLMLDEIAELPLDMQAKLLRVLETHTVMPVGGSESIPVNVRIIAATHRALRKEVEAGRFRADLMFRLRVIPLFLPPLRARAGDVALLAEKMLEELNGKSKRKVIRLSPAAKRALERHSWPGNVRELRNVLEYAFVVGEGPVLEISELPPEIKSPESTIDGEPRLEVKAAEVPASASPEAARILRALERANGSKARAAQALGMSRVTLWRRMKELGLAGGDAGPS